MAGQPGSALYATWVHAGGTLVLTGDQRTFTYTPTVDYIEDTAGADTHKHRLPGLKDGQFSYSAIYQTGGSATLTALAEGLEGTIIWGEEGTASGKPKHTCAAICGGAVTSHPYSDIVEVSVTFQQNGARTDASY